MSEPTPNMAGRRPDSAQARECSRAKLPGEHQYAQPAISHQGSFGNRNAALDSAGGANGTDRSVELALPWVVLDIEQVVSRNSAIGRGYCVVDRFGCFVAFFEQEKIARAVVKLVNSSKKV